MYMMNYASWHEVKKGFHPSRPKKKPKPREKKSKDFSHQKMFRFFVVLFRILFPSQALRKLQLKSVDDEVGQFFSAVFGFGFWTTLSQNVVFLGTVQHMFPQNAYHDVSYIHVYTCILIINVVFFNVVVAVVVLQKRLVPDFESLGDEEYFESNVGTNSKRANKTSKRWLLSHGGKCWTGGLCSFFSYHGGDIMILTNIPWVVNNKIIQGTVLQSRDNISGFITFPCVHVNLSGC